MLEKISDEDLRRAIEEKPADVQALLVKALFLLAHMDLKISVSEENSIRDILASIHWHQDLRITTAFAMIQSEVRAILERTDGVEDFIQELKSLENPDDHQFIVDACRTVAHADGSIGAAESEFLLRIAK